MANKCGDAVTSPSRKCLLEGLRSAQDSFNLSSAKILDLDNNGENGFFFIGFEGRLKQDCENAKIYLRGFLAARR